MDASRLSNKSHLRMKEAKSIIDTFAQPDEYIQKLCQRAQQQKWEMGVFNWDSIDLSGIPQNFRQSAANMFAQLHYGEMAAYLGSARMSEATNKICVRDFFVTQTADEARHIEWFNILLSKLDCEAQIIPSVQTLMNEVSECDTIEEMVVGMHIIIEGMAHSFFLEGTEAFAKASIFKYFMGDSYQSAKTVFTDWLPNFLGKDEGRHLAFGVYFMRNRIQQLTRESRDNLEAKTHHWVQLYQAAAEDPLLLAMPGMNSKGILTRTSERINQHLTTIGLEAKIESC